ncbi:hypothetical protein FLAVO9R_120163 [Flavobacterium sp. 9R]|nr:hypothetical protein FLAVO9R_120163 [Flavobacterium sp. 9R]
MPDAVCMIYYLTRWMIGSTLNKWHQDLKLVKFYKITFLFEKSLKSFFYHLYSYNGFYKNKTT